ncbi:hypothetical protein EV201_1871 [Ancylomarina subtilis]|uniref:Uncharacterized protein n=1 Tax=Ancylomarina subtilis TaxID=1639035 RepID=A0A4Q7VLS9_9BACT|nr:hypothetical protein [Ancylomarina subtilis]RZT97212.1 hypothetical protein EV201_1871 [Ancylomarina subtilis]
MDDNWGNILYLILMALFVIVGALKKKNKPIVHSDGTTPGKAEDDIPTGIDSIFESLLGGEAFAPQQEHPYQEIQEEIVEKEEKAPTYKAPIEPIEYGIPKKVVVEELNQEDEVAEEREEFDWKQAIIYKEILDRKYI